MSWYSDIKAFIANNITTNHARAITGAKMNTVLNDIVDEVDGKVDKVSGKGLSTNDYNNTEKAKVANAYSKPSGGIPKTDLASAVQTSLGKADTAVQTETDPTVPSWAKAQTKPTYTASEVGAIPATDKGANGGVATLDSGGKVPQSQLPSYVDDVLEYANLASLPATGESGKIYVALDTNKTYRWSGSAYVEIAQGLALGETSSTAFPGDRGKAIEDKIPSNASSSNKLATKAEMVPTGGTTGQVLAKKSNTDNDLEWVNQSGGGGGTSNYNDLANKPSINNVTLSGNKTAEQLGLQPTLTIDATPTEGSTNPVQSGGVYDALGNLYQALSVAKNCLFGGVVTRNESPSQGDDHRYYYITQQVGYFPHFDVTVANNEPTAIMIYWSDVFSKWVTIGLWPKLTYVDAKADKVDGAIQGNLAGLDSEGNLTDSGIAASDVATTSDLAGKQDTISDLAAIRSGAAAGATAYQKPASGIPASDLSSAVQTLLGKADTAVQTESDPVFSASPAAGITSGDIADWDGKAEPIPVVDASTIPASMDADKVYQYGTLSGDTTFPALNAPTDLTVAHVYCWTFTTPSTAPTITWPSGITSWAGGSAPTINASKSYEVSVMDGFATIIEN